MRILIVEDDITQQRILRAVLMHAGYDVYDATDGLHAWELVRNGVAQLVITDWMMPAMNGPELIQRIRNADLPQYVYTLLLTARDTSEDVVTGLHAGADDYLIKPFAPRELLARVAVGERILQLETNLRTARDQLEEQATHDYLTGLLNRRAFYQRADQEWLLNNKQGGTLSMLLLDIDHFKRINDQYGHLNGDHMLRLVARVLQDTRRARDLISRWGGEEFAVLLPNTPLSDALAVAERLRRTIANTRLTADDGRTMRCQISIGVAVTTPVDNHSLHDLLQQADASLYNAKHSGRNCISNTPYHPPEAEPDAPEDSDRPALPSSEPGLLEHAIAASQIAISISDAQQPNLPLVYVSSGFEQVTGYTAADVVGQRCPLWKGSAQDAAARATLEYALHIGEPCSVRLHTRHKDGRPLYQQLTLTPLRNAAGHLTHYISLYSNASPQLASAPPPNTPQHTHRADAPQPHTHASEPAGHVLDHQRLIALFTQPDGHNITMLDSLFKLFRQATPITLLALRGALLQQQPQQIAALAHRLKGESSSLGAVRFWQLCRTIEIHASQNELAPIGPLLGELEREFERVSTALATFAASLHSTPTTPAASSLDLPDTS